MTPSLLTLKAKKENVIQPLYNIISQLIEPKLIFSDHIRGKLRQFSEFPMDGYYDSRTSAQSNIMTSKL